MTQLIKKLFIKNYQNVNDPKVRSAYGKVAGLIGVVSNIVLFFIKILIGVFFNSISVIADAVNNLMDSFSSIVTIIGFKISEKPADRDHPFGHARMEYISGMIVSFVVVVLGFQLGKTAVDKILSPEASELTLLSIVILLIAAAVKLWQGVFYKNMGESISSDTLKAVAVDSRGDVISSVSVLLGALITKLFRFNLDGYIGLAVAVFITVSGIKQMIDILNPLLGSAPTKELITSINKKLLSYEGVLGVHDLMVHSYGEGKCFVSVHCEVSSAVNVMESHELMDNIERDFLQDLSIHLTIHMDPIVVDDEETNQMRERVVKCAKEVSETFSVHDFRMVAGRSHTNLIFDVAVPFECKWSENEIITKIDEKINGEDETFRLVVTVDRFNGE